MLGKRLGFGGRLGELDATALAAPARVDLRLDDDNVAAQSAGDRAGLGGREGDLAPWHGDTMLGEDGFGLIFVDFHDV